jgi:hypothetical protein
MIFKGSVQASPVLFVPKSIPIKEPIIIFLQIYLFQKDMLYFSLFEFFTFVKNLK